MAQYNSPQMLITCHLLLISDVHKFVGAAKTATQSILLASFWMLHLERAVLPITVFVLKASSHSVLMARVTVMRITATEPE